MRVSGKVKGVGVNDLRGKYEGKTFTDNTSYITWTNMLNRCYNEDYLEKFPTYRGCKVCDEWLVFSNFKMWMESQKWQGNVLDKDFLCFGAKEYSPSTCIFVPNRLNALIVRRSKEGKDVPAGISFQQSYQKYLVSCSFEGKNKNLGRYACKDEAFKVYKEFKEALIKQLADEYKDCMDLRAYEAVINFKIKE